MQKRQVSLHKYIARKGLFTRLPISDKLKAIEQEIILGRAVLDRALLDSVESSDTFDWFDTNNNDFSTICYVAYLEPTQVERQFKVAHDRLKREQMLGEILDEITES